MILLECHESPATHTYTCTTPPFYTYLHVLQDVMDPILYECYHAVVSFPGNYVFGDYVFDFVLG